MNRQIVIGMALLLGACAATTPRAPTGTGAGSVVPSRPSAATDASYGFEALIAMPFGTLLKDSPLPLHEVLLFNDSASGASSGAPAGATAGERSDCHASGNPPPRFVGRIPERYLLCFEHDRLQRIEASVRLTAAEAPQVLAQFCGHASNGTGVPSAAASGAVASGPGCAGRTGTTTVEAHLQPQAAGRGALLVATVTGPAAQPSPAAASATP